MKRYLEYIYNHHKGAALTKKLTAIALLISCAAFARQMPGVAGFEYSTGSFGGELLSNAVIDMRIHEDFAGIFLATGKGLSRFEDTLIFAGPENYEFLDSLWTSYTTEDGLGKGGLSALDIGNSMIWVATAFDTSTELGRFTAGGGLAWTSDPNSGWEWIPQPIDAYGDSNVSAPTMTNIQNITYDIAITDTTIWIASFGGGLRKYSLQTGQWLNVPPDNVSFNALDNLNHRAFSVITADTLLFAGTAGGVNKSPDGGDTWVNYSFDEDDTTYISGNFVTALGYQHTEDKDIVWAATWPTGGDEYHSVSKTENWGLTWTVCEGLNGQMTHNFAFDDSIAYAATDEGLWKSIDYGDSWYWIPQPEGINYGYSILEPEVYCAGVDDTQLWVGTGDGLASSPDYGNTWFVYRAFVPTGQGGEPSTYAYPNPYSPARWDAVRFQYDLTAPSYVTIRIYDFAMDYVTTVTNAKYRGIPGDYYEIWNGTNSRGDVVANGVYFYKLEKSNQGTAWGKIVILD